MPWVSDTCKCLRFREWGGVLTRPYGHNTFHRHTNTRCFGSAQVPYNIGLEVEVQHVCMCHSITQLDIKSSHRGQSQRSFLERCTFPMKIVSMPVIESNSYHKARRPQCRIPGSMQRRPGRASRPCTLSETVGASRTPTSSNVQANDIYNMGVGNTSTVVRNHNIYHCGRPAGFSFCVVLSTTRLEVSRIECA